MDKKRFEELAKKNQEVEALNAKRVQELERISGLTSVQAKEYLLKTVEEEVKHETAVMVKEMESQAREEADKALAALEAVDEKPVRLGEIVAGDEGVILW